MIKNNDANVYGGMLYFNDEIKLSVATSSVTATVPVSVDGSFTITSKGSTGITTYIVQVNNSRPYLNENITEIGINPMINPDFEANWNNYGNFSVSGFFVSDSNFRFIRIIRSAGIEPNARFYVYPEKIKPVIQ